MSKRPRSSAKTSAKADAAERAADRPVPNDTPIGRPISRAEALRIAHDILQRAERERRELAELEASRGIQYKDEIDVNWNRNLPQFLFDDRLIANQQRLVRRWFAASVSPDPLLVPDRSWEGRSLTLYGSVFPDPAGGWRMYYSNFVPDRKRSLLMLATSRDGFAWEKPVLGQVEYDGSTANNVLIPAGRSPHSPCVIYDEADAEFPWKLCGFWNDQGPAWNEKWGMYAWRSRDGLRWEELPGRRARMGDRCSLFRDPRTGRYVFLSRDPDQFGVTGGRHISRSESADFVNWSPPELILAPDLDDEPDVEFYGMPVFERNGWYFGLLEYWDSAADVIEVHLAVSPDGKQWTRPLPRRPFIAATYDWNQKWTTCANNGPVIMRDQMAFYFGGRWMGHGWDAVRHHGVVGVASLPVDRFCAIEGLAGGQFTTVPLPWPGGELALNADTRESFESHPGHCNGEIGVEILDSEGAPLPDWSGEKKAVFRGNTHCRGGVWPGEVQWPDGRKLGSLAGRTIRLRFHLRHARLFTLTASAT